MEKSILPVLSLIAQVIFDKKGSNILVLDVRPCSLIADYAVIAEGSADRHVIAIAGAVEKVMEEAGLRVAYTQGVGTGDWVVLDFTEIVVHLFMPGMRDRYDLEQLWRKSEIVDISIDVSLKVL